jgi:hypothetical protein
MKTFILLAILCGAMGLCGGCGSTPAYTAQERGQLIWRNINYQGAQAMDDIDSALLLRPSSRLTIWNVR